MNNIPPETFAQIKEKVKRPEGTFTFEYKCEELFNADIPNIMILDLVSGAQIFRLERNNELQIRYYHSSPGTGTRVATVNLNELKPSNQIFVAITWTPKEINLHVGSRNGEQKLISSTGISFQKKLIVGNNGNVFEIGDQEVEVMGYREYMNGVNTLQPTALDAWKNTVVAVEILSTGSSEDGYIFEVIVTNLTIAILVTGFETYCKTRFIEIEKEGINPDLQLLVKKFKRKLGHISNTSSETEPTTLNFSEIVDEINFQNYDECKTAYNKGYGIKFGEIGIYTHQLERLQKFIAYRHRIIHVSPTIGVLNEGKVPPENPEFPKKELRDEVTKCFDNFINKLHDATLSLRRVD